jgi:hypothetical protein
MLVETQLFFSSWPYVLERTSNKAIPKNSMVWSSPTGRKNRPYQKKILLHKTLELVELAETHIILLLPKES